MEPVADHAAETLATAAGENLSLLQDAPLPEMAPPPCFFSKVCSARAVMEKAGRSVCRRCSGRLRGVEYPLRDASFEPLYRTARDAAEALDMLEE